MKRIGRGDLIIIILSEKYLRSRYCMRELNYIYDRSLGERKDFLSRLVPVVLPDAKIDTPTDRAAHGKHWKDESEAMQGLQLGREDHELYLLMAEWSLHIGDILAFISDKLSPRTFKAITADDFRAVREVLAQAHQQEIIERFRNDLQDTSKRLKEFRDLKSLHNHLHDLQQVFYNPIQVAVEGAVPATVARMMLEPLGPRLATLVSAIRQARDDKILPPEEFGWFVKLEQSKGLFDTFLQADATVQSLEDAGYQMDSILRIQPAKINRMMVQMATDLNLDHLVAVITKIHFTSNRLGVTPYAADDASSLTSLNDRLHYLINRHNQWQSLNDEFLSIDPGTAPSRRIEIAWDNIWRVAQSLIESSQEEWSANLRKKGNAIAAALQQKDFQGSAERLRAFQREVQARFYDADDALLRHCDNLNAVVGKSLSTLLQAGKS
jgi:hypothetical protein